MKAIRSGVEETSLLILQFTAMIPEKKPMPLFHCRYHLHLDARPSWQSLDKYTSSRRLRIGHDLNLVRFITQ